ncbi:MAG TPA: S8 family serine peptidase, partial [Anaerolineaceae bacterium]|nr:S8 family serine peptidase [Anaerolineaceae bacterium]
PALDNARPAQNATEVNSAGYNGLGVTVAVLEGERAFFANPALVLNAAYDGLQPYTNHPTAVCGFIKSTAAGFEGLANGATVDSANGSYSNWGTMTAAMDWATTNDTVINNSWYWDSGNSAVFWEADRRLDYYVRHNYDFVSVAAGNFGNGCGTNFSTYVVSPAKGYNVLSVGNYEDQDNINWSDDAMDYCSSFGNPGSDSATPTRDKPEVSAIGATMDSTLPSAVAPLTGPVGSGTSYSSPMVAALAADLIQAQPTLADKPESLRAIIMATALHNVEGGAVNSDKDGTGGVDFTAALATAEREQFTSQYVESTTTYPLTFYLTAHQGERVRYVATWLSNPNAAYTTDVLPADLELYAYRADGSTYITSSTSSVNNYEIVEFIAPATETYVFKVFKFSFSGSLTWLGTAGWRGEYRISPLIYYSDPVASPLGTHLAIYPADWTHSNYWRVLGLRSVNSDHDLRLNSASLFDDPSSRSYLAGSSSGASIDMVVVDGNHRSSALSEHYLVSKFSGPGGYDVDWSNNNGVLLSGTSGPFTRGSALPADIHDLYLDPGLWRILIVPNGLSNTSNLSAYLFASSSIDTYSWTQGAYSAAAHSDVSTSTLTTEGFFYNAPAADYYGLVISGVSAGSSSYYVKVERVVFLPAVMR